MTEWLYILTLLGAVQGIFFSLVLFGLPGGKRHANRYLAMFLLFFSWNMLGVVAYFSRWVLDHPHFGLTHTPIGACIGAPFLWYLLALTGKNFKFRLSHAAMLLPAVVVAVWLVPFYALPADTKREVLEQSYVQIPTIGKYIFLFSSIFNSAYLLAAYLLVLRHERVIKEVYSSPLNKTLTWTRNFLYGSIGVFLSCILLSIWDINWADAYSNLAFSVLTYVFGYRAMRQPEVFTDVEADALPETDNLPLLHNAGKYEKSSIPGQRAAILLERMEQLMSVEKIYLDPNLNLPQLAEKLGITPHLTSQLLNQFRGETFSDFVNRYRVEHFRTAVKNAANAHLSLLAVAYDSGFNSKAAFNAVCKKMTGMTPSELRNRAD